MIKVDKEDIKRVRELMLRVTPNQENAHDFNEAFVIISKMIFINEEPEKEERRCLIGQEINPTEPCNYHTKRLGGEPTFLCNSNCKNWVYKLPEEIKNGKKRD